MYHTQLDESSVKEGSDLERGDALETQSNLISSFQSQLRSPTADPQKEKKVIFRKKGAESQTPGGTNSKDISESIPKSP